MNNYKVDYSISDSNPTYKTFDNCLNTCIEDINCKQMSFNKTDYINNYNEIGKCYNFNTQYPKDPNENINTDFDFNLK